MPFCLINWVSPFSQRVLNVAGLCPRLEETPGGFIWRHLFLPCWSPFWSSWTNRLLLWSSTGRSTSLRFIRNQTLFLSFLVLLFFSPDLCKVRRVRENVCVTGNKSDRYCELFKEGHKAWKVLLIIKRENYGLSPTNEDCWPIGKALSQPQLMAVCTDWNVNGLIIVPVFSALLLKESHMSQVGPEGHRDNKLQPVWACLMLTTYEPQSGRHKGSTH